MQRQLWAPLGVAWWNTGELPHSASQKLNLQKFQASLSLPTLPENSIDSPSPILVLPDHNPGKATSRTPWVLGCWAKAKWLLFKEVKKAFFHSLFTHHFLNASHAAGFVDTEIKDKRSCPWRAPDVQWQRWLRKQWKYQMHQSDLRFAFDATVTADMKEQVKARAPGLGAGAHADVCLHDPQFLYY